MTTEMPTTARGTAGQTATYKGSGSIEDAANFTCE